MATPEFWRNLADRFLGLPEEKWRLCAVWTDSIYLNGFRERKWQLHAPSETLKLRFEAMAIEGGTEISTFEEDPFIEWLEMLLFIQPVNERNPEAVSTVRRNNGAVEMTGSLSRLADASERLCRHTEVQELRERASAAVVTDIATGENLGRDGLIALETPIFQSAPELDSVGHQIEALRMEANVSQDRLAELVSLDIRNVQRHIADETTPVNRNISRYEREFSKLLNRKVVINKTP